MLERKLGPIGWQSTPLDRIVEVLDEEILRGKPVYSAAYIMPSPSLGHERKHANHVAPIGPDDGGSTG